MQKQLEKKKDMEKQKKKQQQLNLWKAVEQGHTRMSYATVWELYVT